MALPIESLVADWFVADLNTPPPTWSLAFTAVRKPTPVWRLDELGTLRCSVTAIELENEQEARDLHRFSFKVAVDFQKLLTDPTDNAAVDALGTLLQEVHDYYRNTAPQVTVAGLDSAEVIDAQRPFAYDLERLDVQGVFESYLILTVQGYRA